MNEAIGRLKNWRIWLGSTVILLIQALMSFNLKFHSESLLLAQPESWLNAASVIFFWYLPAVIAAPLIVAFAPMTRLADMGWLRFIAINTIYILSATLAIQLLAIAILYFGLAQDWGQGSIINMVGYFYRSTPWHADIVLIFALFALGYALDYSQRLRRKELQAERLKLELVSAELQALKSQLNPHFLFNVLNGISGLIRVGRHDDATDSLSDLSTMLRTILENRDTEMVTVKEEMTFIELYLALQKMRFNDKLEVQIDMAEGVSACSIPFMVMQPLVENAIHHGAQMERTGNRIHIMVYKNADKLHFDLINRVPESTGESGFGIGIGNNRARMEKIYGEEYSLQLQALQDRYFKTSLTLPLSA